MSTNSVPNAIEAERAVLGTMVNGHGFKLDGVEALGEGDFYSARNREIFRAMQSLDVQGHAIDLVSVVEELRSRGTLDAVGGSPAISDLSETAFSPATVSLGLRKIHVAVARRRIVIACREAEQAASDASIEPAETVEALMNSITTVGSNGRGGLVPASEAAPEALAVVEHPEKFRPRFPSGLGDLDALTTGWKPGEIVIVAGRPSMGKTALLVGFALEAARQGGEPVAFFSLEMNITAIMLRAICQVSGANLLQVQKGDLRGSEKQRLQDAVASVASLPLHVADLSSTMVRGIRLHAKRLKARHGLGLVVVDYLQLIRGPKSPNREQEVSAISRGLKTLAKELDVPVLVGSQLSREVDRRQNKRPVLADLRESGAIEQDADIVCFIHRPYKDKPGATGAERREAVLIVGKQRNGPTGDVKLVFEPTCARFTCFARAAPG